MENSEKHILKLKHEIKARDKDIHLAATYGKQLYEEKAELKDRFDELYNEKEVLEQEKHCLQLELEASNQTVNSLISETEFQRDRADDLQDVLKKNERENDAMNKKILNLLKENQYFKKVQEDLGVENKSLKDKISLQGKQIMNFQDQAEKSLCEAETVENPELQAQLNSYMLNNKELQNALSESQCQLEMAKKNENHLMQMVKDLEEAVCDRDAEIRASSAEIKKLKDDMEELQAEMELLKFDQVDPKRRGNSVFAELDDRRNLVEREYKKLQKKFENFNKYYEENKMELDRARGQIAILQSMASRDYQQTYIDRLEESLSTAKQEIQELTHKLSKAFKKNVELSHDESSQSKKSEYNYLRLMLTQSQQKEKELQSEAMNLRMKNMYENEKLNETQQLLYKAKQNLDSAKQEIAKLNLKIQDWEHGFLHCPSPDHTASKPNVEVLDGFKPSSRKGNLDKTFTNHLLDETIIPGELVLDDDGFRQVKPKRKSNKFVLQEFNRLDDSKGSGKDVPSHKQALETGVNYENENHRNETLLVSGSQSRTKVSSSRQYENCAQQ